ncbi:MAG TPA: glycoside hydrolase family 13 protein [Nitriliruptoraceae bacterium]|nr:glycoside hydrolase family 13 protein [Nitriliruptoraceae bacterium]
MMTDDAQWWRRAVVYQVYPRSFADSNGDGIGDLAGITSRVGYLRDLGVDAVWLSPFYPSALADGGYDVDDHRDVDRTLGTLDDVDDLVTALHDVGIRLVIDVVPNHTSDRHAWFREALADQPGSAARERYVFRDGTGADGSRPPSDWQSLFGGPAWTRVPDGQWYLHLFAPQQPDLDWSNHEVRDDFRRTLRFWADRGVDGFRVDVAHGLAKDLTEPFTPASDLPDPMLADGSHPYWDRDEVHDIYAEWRHLFNEYDPPRSAVAEASVHHTRRPRYASPDGLGQAFNFDLLAARWDPDDLRDAISTNVAQSTATGASLTWVLSNHDSVRHATRYGLPQDGDHDVGQEWLLSNGTTPALDRDLGRRRARAAVLLLLALPGSAYLYQGEELGLHEVGDLPRHVLQDPLATQSGGAQKGRDGCRVPLPWTREGPSLGFGDAPPHLPQPDWFVDASVAVQAADPHSTLRLYRDAIRCRRTLGDTDEMQWHDSTPDVLHFVRSGGWQAIANLGSTPIPVPDGTIVLTSAPLLDSLLPPDTAAWIIPNGS